MAEVTGMVESQLGRMVDILKVQEGPMAEDGQTASALLEVYLDGPKTESALFHEDEPGQPWCVGAFGRACQSLYIQMLGGRISYAHQKHRPSDGRDGQKGWHVSVVLTVVCSCSSSGISIMQRSVRWSCATESL